MPKKILLADDSVTIQKVVELTFMEGDYEVTCVSNGKAAVQKLQEARPDILLCDVIMPEMNGYEVASFVKKNQALSSIPVILLTGTFEPFDEEKARGSGADTYITKPFDSRLLIEKVEELISRRAAMQVAPASGEAVQIFQSRQEFTLGALPEAPRSEPSVPPAPLRPGAEAFTTEEPEFMMPTEEVGMATVRVLIKPREAPAPPEEPQAQPAQKVEDESPFMAPALDEAAKPAVTPRSAPLEPAPEKTPPPVMEMPEAVDLGPMQPEDAIPEAAFSDVVAPAHEFLPEPGEVILPPEAVAKPEEAPAPPQTEPSAVSAGGAEDWGAPGEPVSEAAVEAEEKWAVFETGAKEAEPEPEIIHSMADQQEMVSEAQAVLDQQRLEHGAPEARTSFEEESIAAAVEVYAVPVPANAEAEATQEAPSPPPYDEVPEQEVPYLPEEGVETGLPEIIEPVPPAPSLQVLEPEATVGREVIRDFHAEVPVEHVSIEEAAVEEPPTLDQPRLEEAVPPAPEIEAGELPVMAALAPHTPVIDRSQMEAMIRSLVGEMAPRLIREAAAALSPEIVRQVASEAVSGEVRRLTETAVPEEARKAAADVVPEHARQAVAQAVPGHVAELAQAALPAAIRAVAEPMIPEIVRQVADEKAAEIIRQVAQNTAPALVAEAVKSALPEMIAMEIREMAQNIIKDVAWEVIPELAEGLIKRRIQELESEVG